MDWLHRYVQDSTTNRYVRPLCAWDRMNIPDYFKTRILFHISFRPHGCCPLVWVWDGTPCPQGNVNTIKKGAKEVGRRGQQLASRDVEAGGVKQEILFFLLFVHLQAGLKRSSSPSSLFFSCISSIYPHSLLIYLTQVGQLRPPQAAETIM